MRVKCDFFNTMENRSQYIPKFCSLDNLMKNIKYILGLVTEHRHETRF